MFEKIKGDRVGASRRCRVGPLNGIQLQPACLIRLSLCTLAFRCCLLPELLERLRSLGRRRAKTTGAQPKNNSTCGWHGRAHYGSPGQRGRRGGGRLTGGGGVYVSE